MTLACYGALEIVGVIIIIINTLFTKTQNRKHTFLRVRKVRKPCTPTDDFVVYVVRIVQRIS